MNYSKPIPKISALIPQRQFIDINNKSKKWARPEPVPEPLDYEINIDQATLLADITDLKQLLLLDVRDIHERELFGAIELPPTSEKSQVTVKELPLDEL